MDNQIKKYEVNGQTVWTGRFDKVKGSIQEKPITFHVRPLNIGDAEAMGDFSKTIYENLRKGEECFIHKHSKEYFHQIFQNQNIRYIGAFVGKNLIGMSYMKICRNNSELQDELPNSNYDFFNPNRNNGKTIVASFGGDSVLPEYRGNNLNTIMINYRLEEAHHQGCTDCTSIVDRNNKWNMRPYFNCWFNLFETSIDPSDGGKISLLHKPIENETVLSCFKARIALPYDRLELIDKIIQKGFIGIEYNAKTTEVTFAHSSYYNQRNAINNNDLVERALQEYQSKII